MCKRTIEIPQELGRSCRFLGDSRPEIPGDQLPASAVHSAAEEQNNECNRGTAKRRKRSAAGWTAGSRSTLIVPMKPGNRSRGTRWREGKTERGCLMLGPGPGNTSEASYLEPRITVTTQDSSPGIQRSWMANPSSEEPDALMCARPVLWEPWAGNRPGPPGPLDRNPTRLRASVTTSATVPLGEGAVPCIRPAGGGQPTAITRRVVRHDILHFSARVFATIVALASATPHPGGFKRRLWREQLSIRGSSRRFPVAPPAGSGSWLLTI
jgi:hypothetical protein